MTEAEWLAASDPGRMLIVATRIRSSFRKLQLLACLCGERVKERLWRKGSRAAVETLARFLDGSASDNDLRVAHDAARADWEVIIADASEQRWYYLQEYAAEVAYRSSSPNLTEPVLQHVLIRQRESIGLAAEQEAEAIDGERNAQAGWLRDIFGNPFRPVSFDPSWRTSTVVALADQMYEARDFTPMPVLADALQDAGCDRDAILDHCRGDGPHVRGCWVVDLVLGKE